MSQAKGVILNDYRLDDLHECTGMDAYGVFIGGIGNFFNMAASVLQLNTKTKHKNQLNFRYDAWPHDLHIFTGLCCSHIDLWRIIAVK